MGNRLYVGNLPFDANEEQLRTAFAACGQVASIKLITDKFSGQSRGFGFVEMASDADAKAAIQKLNGTAIGSRQIVVNEARPQEDRAGGRGFGGRPDGGRGGGGKQRRGGGGGRW